MLTEIMKVTKTYYGYEYNKLAKDLLDDEDNINFKEVMEQFQTVDLNSNMWNIKPYLKGSYLLKLFEEIVSTAHNNDFEKFSATLKSLLSVCKSIIEIGDDYLKAYELGYYGMYTKI